MSPDATPSIGTTELGAGWHEGLEMSAYLADPAVSASMLWDLHESTPAHFVHRIRNRPDDETPAKSLGSLTHTRVFEPEVFDERYVVLGQCEAKKRDGTPCTNQGLNYRDGQSFCGVKGHDPYGKDEPPTPGIDIVTEQQREAAIAMHDALRAHPTASAILSSDGPREVTGVWQDKATGLWCRLRPDLLIEAPETTRSVYHHSVVNLKTTGKSAAPGDYERDSNRLGVHFKAAFYRMGVRELWGLEPQNFFYPVVESHAPHEVIVYRLHEDAMDVGEAEVREALTMLARCLESGEWPGYGRLVHDLSLPEWRLRRIHDTDFLEVA